MNRLLKDILHYGAERYTNIIFSPDHVDALKCRYPAIKSYIMQGYIDGQDGEVLDFIMALDTDAKKATA